MTEDQLFQEILASVATMHLFSLRLERFANLLSICDCGEFGGMKAEERGRVLRCLNAKLRKPCAFIFVHTRHDVEALTPCMYDWAAPHSNFHGHNQQPKLGVLQLNLHAWLQKHVIMPRTVFVILYWEHHWKEISVMICYVSLMTIPDQYFDTFDPASRGMQHVRLHVSKAWKLELIQRECLHLSNALFMW